MLALILVAACASASAQTTTDSAIRSIQIHLKMYPQDFKSYDALGASYIQKGRETADATYFELAKEALDKSLDLVSNGPAAASAKTHLAEVAMSEHQFEEALSWAQEALAHAATRTRASINPYFTARIWRGRALLPPLRLTIIPISGSL
jgi:tetratricopeptide (TPR) repeat protein